jgi:RNA polymerase sigma-70 factor (ECF subfamily)
MNAEQFNSLLQRLRDGDCEAAEKLYIAYEPYLRRVVRCHLSNRLRTKFDSTDVVQSVWVHVLHGVGRAGWQFREEADLRALLGTVARRRLISRYRHHRLALERELPGAEVEMLPARRQPRPSEVAQAEELWAKLLRLCPPAHHEILRLRRRGLLLEEIAKRTGMHEGSVRRILRRLARRFASEQEPPTAACAAKP